MDWSSIGSIASAAGIFLAVGQLRASAKSARTAFEDALAREYREIARAMPMEAHLNDVLSPEDFERALPRFFQYVDLSNQQVFLRKNGRIGRATWLEWAEGIEFNLSRKTFRHAWETLKARDGETFNELRRLEAEGFAIDPRSWVSPWERLKAWWIH